ncbi:MAG: polyprenyl synthetase family protein [Cyanobacteria bacterium P01_H01_bin.74]
MTPLLKMQPTVDAAFAETLEIKRQKVHAALSRCLSAANFEAASEEAPELLAAIQYGTLDGGKRLRALLAIETYLALGGKTLDAIMPVACALEMLHAQSLVHDDLPCMDNDSLRRGKPSLHIAFNEHTAVLVGDALIALAFGQLSKALPLANPQVPASVFLRIISDFSEVSSLSGLINGQFVDIKTEGQAFDEARLQYIHRYKTGALFKFSLQAASLLAFAQYPQTAQKVLEIISNQFGLLGEKLGLAFQIVDDLLDIAPNEDHGLGKTSGKDQAQQKATYPALFDEATCQEKLTQLATEIERSLVQHFDAVSHYARPNIKLDQGPLTQLIQTVLFRSY